MSLLGLPYSVTATRNGQKLAAGPFQFTIELEPSEHKWLEPWEVAQLAFASGFATCPICQWSEPPSSGRIGGRSERVASIPCREDHWNNLRTNEETCLGCALLLDISEGLSKLSACYPWTNKTRVSFSTDWVRSWNHFRVMLRDNDDDQYWRWIGDRYICSVPPGKSYGLSMVVENYEMPIIGSGGYTYERADCQGSFGLIRAWLGTCTSSHPECRSTSALGLLPKRVLDVGLVVGSHNIRLYESNGHVAPYVALSHCWGQPCDHPPKTTRATLEQNKQGIEWNLLSKTFRDAIYITQVLQLRFIWIDALCIVQDDDRDWQHQAGQMGDIYSSAFLTIAATGSKSGRDGLFIARVDRVELASGLTIRPDNADIHDHLQSRIARSDKPPDGLPLCNRGWCIQERLLSKRILHYTPHEIVWECDTEVKCECGWLSSDSPSFKRFAVCIKSPAATKPAYYSTVWGAIVEEYTSTTLTKEEDILPALAGLASRFHNATTGRYLAGIWESHLPESLLWYCLKPRRRPHCYTAPSFSWASLSGGVVVYRGHFLRSLAILEVHCSSSDLNIFGAVTDGYLKCRGCLVRGGLRCGPMKTVEVSGEHGKSLRDHKFIHLDTEKFDTEWVYNSPDVFFLQVTDSAMLILSKKSTGAFERQGILFDLSSMNKPWASQLDKVPGETEKTIVVIE